MNGITSTTQTQAARSTQAATPTSSVRKVNDTANAYLAELRKNNPSVNIAVANFSSEKQFDAYMFGVSGARL